MSPGYQAFCWITAQADGMEHVVTDDAQAHGMSTGKGWFAPVCGRRFLPACMDQGPVGRCSKCAWLVQARADLRAFHKRLTAYRQDGWLNRLLRRYEQPADTGSETPLTRNTSAGACIRRASSTAAAPADTHRRRRVRCVA